MRILTVFTGGTIGSSRVDGAICPQGSNAPLLLRLYHENYGAADFDTVAPYTVLSENLSAENLAALQACLTVRMSNYDGVIVTHGTDTLQYTAAFLDFVLGAQQTPVVLVSANYPLADSRSNGLCNFAAAVDFIRAKAGQGVFVAYRNTGDSAVSIHRGVCVLPHLPLDDSVFSLFNRPYGTVENGVFRKNPNEPAAFRPNLSACRLNGSVLFLRPCVGAAYPEIPSGTKAVLLEGWHSGTLPTGLARFADFCESAALRQIPLFLTGSQPGFEYSSKQAFKALGIRVLPPMPPVAAYMLLWLLNPEQLKDFI